MPALPVSLLLVLTDPVPEPADVKAGWTALVIFLVLAASVAFLGWSLTKQLRKADDARKAGVYGDEPEAAADPTGAAGAADADRS